MSIERREFIKGAAATASLVFVGCRLVEDASAQSPGAAGAKRRLVSVKGKRIKTVDVHAHCAVPRASALLRRPGAAVNDGPLVLDGQTLSERLAAMDTQGIDMAILSINPNWYDADRDLATQVIEIQNEGVAQFCASHADRFAAFASVALQFPDLAAGQLERAMKTMGFRGAAIGGSVAGRELADPSFDPFWAKAEELSAVVFIHPQASGTADFGARLKGNGMLGNVIGNPLETTIALSHMIFEGTLDRFPGLKVCAAHGGGYLPSYAARSDAGCTTFPERCSAVQIKKKPTEYLRQLYFDSIVFTPQALRHLVTEVGASQIVMGTDYPFPWTSTSVDHILNTPGLSDADRAAMLGDTAAKLLGIKS